MITSRHRSLLLPRDTATEPQIIVVSPTILNRRELLLDKVMRLNELMAGGNDGRVVMQFPVKAYHPKMKSPSQSEVKFSEAWGNRYRHCRIKGLSGSIQ